MISSLVYTALEMLMVDPAYQNQGAGRLLVKWGIAAADERGVDVSFEIQPTASALS